MCIQLLGEVSTQGPEPSPHYLDPALEIREVIATGPGSPGPEILLISEEVVDHGLPGNTQAQVSP